MNDYKSSKDLMKFTVRGEVNFLNYYIYTNRREEKLRNLLSDRKDFNYLSVAEKSFIAV